MIVTFKRIVELYFEMKLVMLIVNNIMEESKFVPQSASTKLPKFKLTVLTNLLEIFLITLPPSPCIKDKGKVLSKSSSRVFLI